jgi:hypothetical protein
VRLATVLQFAKDFTAEIHGRFLVLANSFEVAAGRKGTATAPGVRVVYRFSFRLPAATQTSISPQGWFPGFGAVLADYPGAFPDFSSGLLPRFRSTTVAGAAPDFDRLPNSPPSLKGGTLSIAI